MKRFMTNKFKYLLNNLSYYLLQLNSNFMNRITFLVYLLITCPLIYYLCIDSHRIIEYFVSYYDGKKEAYYSVLLWSMILFSNPLLQQKNNQSLYFSDPLL